MTITVLSFTKLSENTEVFALFNILLFEIARWQNLLSAFNKFSIKFPKTIVRKGLQVFVKIDARR